MRSLSDGTSIAPAPRRPAGFIGGIVASSGRTPVAFASPTSDLSAAAAEPTGSERIGWKRSFDPSMIKTTSYWLVDTIASKRARVLVPTAYSPGQPRFSTVGDCVV